MTTLKRCILCRMKFVKVAALKLHQQTIHHTRFDPDTERMFKIRNAMEHRAFKFVDALGISRLHERDTDVTQHKNDLLHIQKEIADLERHLQNTPSNASELAAALDKLKGRELTLRKDLDDKERLSTYFLTLGVEEFESLTMKLLTLAKDALVYLSLAVHHEESMRPQTALTIPSVVPKK